MKRVTVIVCASFLLVVVDCQYRRIKYRDDNYYERLYKRRMEEEEMQKFSQNAFHRRLGNTYAKFPIIPPRLRSTENDQRKDRDEIDHSSTNLNPAVLWELPLKHLTRSADSLSTSPAPLEKLMRPKPTRPQAYSLDGFVPKPSNIEIAVQAPPTFRKAFVLGDTVTVRGKKSRGKKEKLKNELPEKKTRSGSASNRRRSSKKGIPGVDYPDFVQIPETSFSCENKRIAGMYADKEAGCQVWHICTGVTKVAKARHSFLCAAGTIYSEKKGVCDWWYNVQC